MRSLFLVAKGDKCITHDGYMQLGTHSHSAERHKELNPAVDWQEVYWIPDVFSKRYKRVTFQQTQACNAGSPKTDNAGDNRPRDFPYYGGPNVKEA